MKKQLFFISVVVLLQTVNCILPTISCAQKIAGGGYHSLAACSNGTVWVWGYNNSGQLGNGNYSDSNIPVQVSGLTGIIAVAGGGYHSLALKNDGTVWAWGNNTEGELGNGNNIKSNVPVQVNGLTGIIAIAAGWDHSLALKNDGTVWTWGFNAIGQLGNGNNTSSNIPEQLSSLAGITAIAAGLSNSFALKNDGTVWAWGYNSYGQLGNGTNTDTNFPVEVSSLINISAISGGFGHTLALSSDSMVWSWGYNIYGQLGNGIANTNIPVQVNSLTGITAIAAGTYHSLALKYDGTEWVWGYNSEGQLGNGNNIDSNGAAMQLSGLTGIAAIAGGLYHSLALKNDGTVWDWGYNFSGQLGNGANTDTNVPVEVLGLCPVLISVNDASTPLSMSLSVFPNPASGNSFINYTLSSPATVSIDLYDVLGNKLQQLVNGNQEQGEHNATIDASKLANGVYVLQIRAGDQIASQKIVVMN